ncbi:hypothetical protein [Stutzerimonas balearica]|jgi:hypothetical protein|uniref:Uncharacterized protein n=3 Tax=Stutzerimonas balearica TaxID=74829 RepID=A0ABY0R702_9GAMM|nr:hypothetical protein [Stutzerimonas balearica]SDM67205.1 hypothetical protein SAMN05660875_10788 [Stutzerimonas balearica DSM 6083]
MPMSLSWMVMLFSSFAALLLMLLCWLQWLRCKAQCVELDVLRGLMQGVGEVIRRLEQQNAELAAGLRAERAQAEQLRRQLQLLRGLG